MLEIGVVCEFKYMFGKRVSEGQQEVISLEKIVSKEKEALNRKKLKLKEKEDLENKKELTAYRFMNLKTK